MDLMIIFALLFFSVVLFSYQLSSQKIVQEVHLPVEMRRSRRDRSGAKGIFAIPAQIVGSLVSKLDIPAEHIRRRLLSAGMPMNVSQFIGLKILLMIILPTSVFIVLNSPPIILIIALGIGYVAPDFWLKGKIKNRQMVILRDLPHVIDLLNICVSAGLDFMVAVNRVISEFHQCVLVDEFRILIHEIQVGVSRRDALKNLSKRVSSPEILSFVRTLGQADRMGTPIGQALKMLSEEIRLARFQKGEEAALKAPIKLLLPLLVFIMPVVLIIVAGPILIQFTRGDLLKF